MNCNKIMNFSVLYFSPFPHVVSLEHFSLTAVFNYVYLLFVMWAG